MARIAASCHRSNAASAARAATTGSAASDSRSAAAASPAGAPSTIAITATAPAYAHGQNIIEDQGNGIPGSLLGTAQ